jgi:hypothetical protein
VILRAETATSIRISQSEELGTSGMWGSRFPALPSSNRSLYPRRAPRLTQLSWACALNVVLQTGAHVSPNHVTSSSSLFQSTSVAHFSCVTTALICLLLIFSVHKTQSCCVLHFLTNRVVYYSHVGHLDSANITHGP